MKPCLVNSNDQGKQIPGVNQSTERCANQPLDRTGRTNQPEYQDESSDDEDFILPGSRAARQRVADSPASSPPAIHGSLSSTPVATGAQSSTVQDGTLTVPDNTERSSEDDGGNTRSRPVRSKRVPAWMQDYER